MAEDIDKLVKLAREAAHSIRTDATASQVGLSDEETDLIADALERLLSRVSELEAERDDYRARLRTWLDDYSRTPDGLGVHVPVYQIERFTRLAARSTEPQAQVRAEAGASAAPDGWQLVPKDEMPASMIAAGQRYIESKTLGGKFDFPATFNWHEFYAAMLSASPTPPAAEAVGGDSVFNVIEPYSQSDGDGPAAPTASDDWPTGFKPDWKLTPHEQIAVTLNLALAKVPDWPGCTDEQLDALAQAVLSSPPVREIVGALKKLRFSAAVLQQTAEGCVVNHHSADFETQGLPGWLVGTQKDIDNARSILSRFQSGGGEKHDHADGALAEAVGWRGEPEHPDDRYANASASADRPSSAVNSNPSDDKREA